MCKRNETGDGVSDYCTANDEGALPTVGGQSSNLCLQRGYLSIPFTHEGLALVAAAPKTSTTEWLPT